jgi:hypothetical protein
MENQTRYNLNAAVENWRNELAAQPNLASDWESFAVEHRLTLETGAS